MLATPCCYCDANKGPILTFAYYLTLSITLSAHGISNINPMKVNYNVYLILMVIFTSLDY